MELDSLHTEFQNDRFRWEANVHGESRFGMFGKDEVSSAEV